MHIPGPVEQHPAYRALVESLAVEMEHLDPATAPDGEDTTKVDLLRARLQRMLSEGQEPSTDEWIVEFLDRLDRWALMRAPLQRLDQLERERGN